MQNCTSVTLQSKITKGQRKQVMSLNEWPDNARGRAC